MICSIFFRLVCCTRSTCTPLSCVFFLYCYGHLRVLHSFPTRRSSDLTPDFGLLDCFGGMYVLTLLQADRRADSRADAVQGDRMSTRLNSSHRTISYAVFCLKKKSKRTGYESKTHERHWSAPRVATAER